MATKEDLEIYQGETFEHTFNVSDDVDLSSGFEAKVQFRFNPLDTVILAQFTDIDGLTLNADGTIDLKIEASETIDFVWPSATYDLRVTEIATSEVEFPFVGVVKVTPSVTKDAGSFNPVDPLGGAAWAQETEVVSNPLDKTITMANTPIVSGSHLVALNGQILTNGVDYMVSGVDITLVAEWSLFVGDRLSVFYQYKV